MLSKYISIFLWAFLFGIVIVHGFTVPPVIVYGGVCLGLMCLSAITCFKKEQIKDSNDKIKHNIFNLIKNCVGFGLGLGLGVMVWINNQHLNEYQNFTGQSVDIEGKIASWPNITASGNQAIMVLPDGFTQALRATFRVPINYHPGDRVWIRGNIKQLENFSSFNYVAYLQRSNVYAELDKPKVIIIKTAQVSKLAFLDSLRQWVIKTTTDRLNKSSAGLVLGIVIGYGDSVPKELATAFQKTGLTHILVASGFNLTIIASSIGGLAWVLGRRWSDIFSMAIIWMFVILTGSSGSVVRAGIMVSLILLARGVGRIPTSYFTLLLAVVVMVFLNPLQLFYDIGFQLSVSATIGVLEANKLRIHLQKEGVLTELLWPTCGAILFTAPIISFYFGTFSIIAPLANLLVLPAVPIVMLLGSLSLLPVLYLLTVPVTELIVKFQEKVTVFLASWQYSSISIKSTLCFVVGYYVLLFLIREVFYYRKIGTRSNK